MRRSAFTLIELLVVVTVMGILVGIAASHFLDAHIRTQISATESNMKSIATALEIYAIDRGAYPNTYWPYTTTLINPRQLRFKRLSTPVVYITNGVRDIFNTVDPEIAAVYTYWGPDTIDHRREGSWFDHPSMASVKRRRGGWCLMSFGPDGDFELAEKPYLLWYDLSNGLRSDGDIYRFGP